MAMVQARIHLIWLLFLIGMVQVHGGYNAGGALEVKYEKLPV